MTKLIATLLVALPVVYGASISTLYDAHDHSHDVGRLLPSKTWYHADDHPVHALFKRATTDGADYPAVGSQAWSAPFPASTPDPKTLPVEWVNALNAAVSAGKIPNIPPSTLNNGFPTYANGLNPNGPGVCSGTYKCRISGDIWDGPPNYFAVSFDDGPTPFTTPLVNFLDQHNESATHFMIGVNIIMNPTQFTAAFQSDNDIAVHTWTHPYMTTLSNLDVLGQLGWTTELIRRSTGGRVPKFWRPPYGDTDVRVSAIAKEIFGMQTVVWNQDTEDWSIDSGGTTPQKVQNSMQQWLTGPKSPGLIILEHELANSTVSAFMAAYPLIKANGWNTSSLAQLVGGEDAYQNAEDSTSNDVISAGILVGSTSTSTSQSSTQIPSATSSTVSASSTSTTASASQSAAALKSNNAAAPIWNHGHYAWLIPPLMWTGLVTAISSWT